MASLGLSYCIRLGEESKAGEPNVQTGLPEAPAHTHAFSALILQ